MSGSSRDPGAPRGLGRIDGETVWPYGFSMAAVLRPPPPPGWRPISAAAMGLGWVLIVAAGLVGCDLETGSRSSVPSARAASESAEGGATASTTTPDRSRPLPYELRRTPFDAEPPRDPEGDPEANRGTASSPGATGGAGRGEGLPLVVALHGRGSRPASFARFFEDFRQPAWILLVEAPIDEGDGRAWWSFRGKTREAVKREMRTLAARIVATTEEVATTHRIAGKPLVMGFSQGAMLVYVLALEHGERFAAAVPVSGALFDSVLPPPGRRLDDVPPITALHGEADPVIPARFGLERLPLLAARGVPVTTETFPEVPHWIMGEMKDALYETLAAAMEAQRVAGRADPVASDRR